MGSGMISSSRGRGRRNLVSEAIRPILQQLAAHSASEAAFVVQADPTDPSKGTLLGFHAVDPRHCFLPNEPVDLTPALTGGLQAVPDLMINSAIRPKRLHCASSLIIPWRAAGKHGCLVAANIVPADEPSITRAMAQRYGRKLQHAYAEAGARDWTRLRLQVAEATRAIAELEQQDQSAEDLFAATLAVGRGLLRTSAVYMSLPEQSADIFTFSSFVGVRTSAFKRLRMGAGQGLGGVTRHERRLVRSLNYAQDFRERDAPVHETVQEGFQSAMCTPLMGDGQISGLLYAANRNLTPFSETDGAMLDEFAANVSLMFKRTQWARLRQMSARRSERQRLARDLHDTVVRKLIEIGYESQLGRDTTHATGAHAHFTAIERAADACLTIIRGQIGAMASDWDHGHQPTTSDVVDLLRTTSSKRGLTKFFDMPTGPGRTILPAAVAAGLLRIGREALQNADLHSGGTRVSVALTTEDRTARLTVDDDGRGLDARKLPELLESHDHLGLRQMRAAAHEIGGTCRLTQAPSGGLRVDVTVPLIG